MLIGQWVQRLRLFYRFKTIFVRLLPLSDEPSEWLLTSEATNANGIQGYSWKNLKRKNTESDDKREKTKKHEENRKAHKFNIKWLTNHEWLDYDESNDTWHKVPWTSLDIWSSKGRTFTGPKHFLLDQKKKFTQFKCNILFSWIFIYVEENRKAHKFNIKWLTNHEWLDYDESNDTWHAKYGKDDDFCEDWCPSTITEVPISIF
jgi:hypothetical protein